MDDGRDIRDQLRNAVSRSSVEDQISWTIYSIFWAGNALIATRLPAGNAWFHRSVLCLATMLSDSLIWHPIQRRCDAALGFLEALVSNLEAHLPLAAEHRLSGWYNPLYTTEVKGPTGWARFVKIISIDVAVASWGFALVYCAFPGWCLPGHQGTTTKYVCRIILAVIGLVGSLIAFWLAASDASEACERTRRRRLQHAGRSAQSQ
jgi:hypothetical protein